MKIDDIALRYRDGLDLVLDGVSVHVSSKEKVLALKYTINHVWFTSRTLCKGNFDKQIHVQIQILHCYNKTKYVLQRRSYQYVLMSLFF